MPRTKKTEQQNPNQPYPQQPYQQPYEQPINPYTHQPLPNYQYQPYPQQPYQQPYQQPIQNQTQPKPQQQKKPIPKNNTDTIPKKIAAGEVIKEHKKIQILSIATIVGTLATLTTTMFGTYMGTAIAALSVGIGAYYLVTTNNAKKYLEKTYYNDNYNQNI